MPKQIPKQEVDTLRDIVSQCPQGISFGKIMSSLDEPLSRRTLQHRLTRLVERGVLQAEGSTRARVYRIPETIKVRHIKTKVEPEVKSAAPTKEVVRKGFFSTIKNLFGKGMLGGMCLVGILFLLWGIFTFAYQFIVAYGSWNELIAPWKESRLVSALWLSISSSCVTVLVALILGIPLAYLFATKKFRGKALLETFSIDVPQTFPPIAEGMIYLLMLGPTSPFHVNVAYTFLALVIAKVYVSAPFVVSNVMTKFRDIAATGVPMTARSLGATPFQTFYFIFLPMSFRCIAAAAALCWARAMGELGGSLIFAGVIAYQTEIIPTFIATTASDQMMPALSASIAVTVISMLALCSFKMLMKRKVV